MQSGRNRIIIRRKFNRQIEPRSEQLLTDVGASPTNPAGVWGAEAPKEYATWRGRDSSARNYNTALGRVVFAQ